ncbi:uncharacterized protein FOMMEDRAFT_18404 [Fomitiporia mediterranea MF3/22]|uniref:uncharacterized protein n=1 Tax=Fomitiporia mediterranea (strain MF3/22) TaxID=694068 RepID=UPI00044099B5|nr:uncharacterized protein FOMMEDRAFT_18404 [Fomitiporia mediterranea MF3/22]EJD06258.1 hypothetical protein FOMMEDRAFT_18404 [Fomitiporia mediterranea MF3/22]
MDLSLDLYGAHTTLHSSPASYPASSDCIYAAQRDDLDSYISLSPMNIDLAGFQARDPTINSSFEFPTFVPAFLPSL